jgi:cytochrome c oxidase subunit 2
MKKMILILGIVLLLAVAGFFIFNGKTTGQVTADADPKVEFTMNAFRFGYSPDVINVKQGEIVKISINNTDTPHGIRIPDLGLSGTDTLEFTAEQKGEYIWYCFIPCGSGHKEMQGKIIIE